MSSRYVRCAPNAVGARSRHHRAERSSVLGICFWPFIVRQHAPIVHPWPCRSPQRPTARAVSSIGAKRTFVKTTTSLIHAILGQRETLFGLWPANGEGATEALYLLVAAVAAYFLFRFRTWRSSGKHNDPKP